MVFVKVPFQKNSFTDVWKHFFENFRKSALSIFLIELSVIFTNRLIRTYN